MGDDIVRVRNSSYAKYEELLMRRDEIKKQAFLYERAYVREFGDLILDVFRMKMEAIRKKKTIGYCQAFANRGEAVDQKALQEYLAKELAEYQEKLDGMIRDHEAAKKNGQISEADLLRIKRIYHRLVKKIHPDIYPLTDENEELSELWQRLIAAYNCNNLREMEETEFLVNALLEKLESGLSAVSIPDIEEKIAELEAEIEKIKSTDPYQYRYLLEDETAVSEKKGELREELKAYEDYCRQLDEVLSGLLQKGVTLTWRMN
jgi:hypothetical protein